MKPARRRPIVRCALALALFAGACGQETGTDDPPSDEWECVDERDGWEQCSVDSVIWCHAVPHGNYTSGHFHESTNCASDGLKCVELDEATAACMDPSTTCEAGFAQCDGRNAQNCAEGSIASMRCSLAESCEVNDGKARCVPLSQGEES